LNRLIAILNWLNETNGTFRGQPVKNWIFVFFFLGFFLQLIYNYLQKQKEAIDLTGEWYDPKLKKLSLIIDFENEVPYLATAKETYLIHSVLRSCDKINIGGQLFNERNVSFSLVLRIINRNKLRLIDAVNFSLGKPSGNKFVRVLKQLWSE
jgi:hypothetical protein